jgi:hypothetical protein
MLAFPATKRSLRRAEPVDALQPSMRACASSSASLCSCPPALGPVPGHPPDPSSCDFSQGRSPMPFCNRVHCPASIHHVKPSPYLLPNDIAVTEFCVSLWALPRRSSFMRALSPFATRPQSQHHIKRALAALGTCSRTHPHPPLLCPISPTAFRHLPCAPLSGTDRAINSSYSHPQSNQTPAAPALVSRLKQSKSGVVVNMAYKEVQDPVIRPSSPAPLAQDFARQQVSKQQRSNYHSSSLASSIPRTMVSQSVNKTGLHPAGVQ